MTIWCNANTERLYRALSHAPKLRQAVAEMVIVAEEASDRVSRPIL